MDQSGNWSEGWVSQFPPSSSQVFAVWKLPQDVVFSGTVLQLPSLQQNFCACERPGTLFIEPGPLERRGAPSCDRMTGASAPLAIDVDRHSAAARQSEPFRAITPGEAPHAPANPMARSSAMTVDPHQAKTSGTTSSIS